MKRGHIPLRSCVVCSAKTDKRDLIRLVRTQSGRVEVDTTSKFQGRGAYLCHRQACWDSALKKNRLDHKLRGTISPEDRRVLWEFAQGMAEASPSDGGARLQNSIL
ncbi:YlxR family protein [SAR202 cluster bacterium AC-647-N09_OGT_505m]|nr:YlxR family protein [SAR202 cluster bacterium AC-647-N09_OGT_505m]